VGREGTHRLQQRMRRREEMEGTCSAARGQEGWPKMPKDEEEGGEEGTCSAGRRQLASVGERLDSAKFRAGGSVL